MSSADKAMELMKGGNCLFIINAAVFVDVNICEGLFHHFIHLGTRQHGSEWVEHSSGCSQHLLIREFWSTYQHQNALKVPNVDETVVVEVEHSVEKLHFVVP